MPRIWTPRRERSRLSSLAERLHRLDVETTFYHDERLVDVIRVSLEELVEQFEIGWAVFIRAVEGSGAQESRTSVDASPE